MGAMKFGMGLVSGFTAQAEKERQANEAKQLKLLQLLKDDEHELIELPSSQIQPQGNFLDTLFGTGQARVGETGEPAIMVGNRGFVRRKYTPNVAPSISESLMSTIAPGGQKIGDIYQYNTPSTDLLADMPTAPLMAVPPQVKIQTPAPSNATNQYATLAAQIAREEGVPEQLIPSFVANTHAESGFNPQAEGKPFAAANGRRAGTAKGMTQLTDETAVQYKVSDVFNPEENLRGGARYFRDLAVQFKNDPDLVVAAYNAGEDAVEQYGGVPPYRQTQAHVKRVQSLTPQYKHYAQTTPSITDIAPSAREPVLPRVEVARVNAQGLDEDQLSSIRSTLAATEALYRATEAGVTKPRQYQALVAANRAKLIVERDKLIEAAKQANRDVLTKERKLLGEVYKVPIPPWVRTPTTVAKFHELMSGFDPDMHASETKRIATQYIAKAVQTDDINEIQKVVPVLTARMAERHFTKADIDEVKEVSGYKAWEMAQQVAATRRATEQVTEETRRRAFADAQKELVGDKPDKEERAFLIQSAAGLAENHMLPTTQSYIARKKAIETPSVATDLPNRVAREIGLPNFAAATPEQADAINTMVEDRQKIARLDEREQAITIQNDLKRHERDITEVPAEKLQYYLDRTTLRPFTQVMTWQELREKNPVPVTPKVLDAVREFAPLRALASEVKYLVDKVYGPNGPLKSIALEKGIKGRLTGRATVLIEQLRNHPDVRQLDERLREWGVQAARTLEGLRGRPAYQLMKPALDVRPSLGDAGFLGFGGRMPDTKETILTQIEGGERVVNRMLTEILSVSVGGIPIPGQARTKTLMERMREQAQPAQVQ